MEAFRKAAADHVARFGGVSDSKASAKRDLKGYFPAPVHTDATLAAGSSGKNNKRQAPPPGSVPLVGAIAGTDSYYYGTVNVQNLVGNVNQTFYTRFDSTSSNFLIPSNKCTSGCVGGGGYALDGTADVSRY